MTMEIFHNKTTHKPVKAVLFDFDGTVSTLRCGWESVMKPLMLEMISGGKGWDAALENEVDAYIDESTGIQTIYQMKWLAETVHARGMNPGAPTDPWWYKGEYNRRLMENIRKRLDLVRNVRHLVAHFHKLLCKRCGIRHDVRDLVQRL